MGNTQLVLSTVRYAWQVVGEIAYERVPHIFVPFAAGSVVVKKVDAEVYAVGTAQQFKTTSFDALNVSVGCEKRWYCGAPKIDVCISAKVVSVNALREFDYVEVHGSTTVTVQVSVASSQGVKDVGQLANVIESFSWQTPASAIEFDIMVQPGTVVWVKIDGKGELSCRLSV